MGQDSSPAADVHVGLFWVLAEGGVGGLPGETVELHSGRAGLEARPSTGARKEEMPYVSSSA